MEELIESKKVYTGPTISVTCDRLRLDTGREIERDIVSFPDNVTIVPILDDGRIVLTHQYRHTVKALTWALPAGKMDPGETPLQTAKRELREETGYTAKKLVLLKSLQVSASYATEIAHLVKATGLTAGKQELDIDEQITIRIFSVEEIRQMVNDGRLNQMKSVTALLLCGVL
ncbi:MAG TPA: NUDIX hydrolase [Blastocatellia bacterium]|nr:NUDIX hydrolase [Blastocatellia bacterium]